MKVGVRVDFIREERGGALLIALTAAIFLTILGTVLLGVVRQGFVHAVSTEALVQAESLAQKGLDEAQALIRLAVEEANYGAPGGFSYATRVERIHHSLGKDIDPSATVMRAPGSLHHFIHDSEITGLKGSYKLEILSDQDNFEAFSANIATVPDYPYSRVIRLRSTGIVGDKPMVKVDKQAEFVVSTIHAVFKYPLSAKENIYLQGAAAIRGDVLARQGSLHTDDVAQFIGLPGTSYSKPSDFPSIRGFYREHTANDNNRFSHWIPFNDPYMPLDEDIQVWTDYVEPKLHELAAAMPASGAGFHSGSLLSLQLPSYIAGLKLEEQWLHAGSVSTVYGDMAIKHGAFTMEADAAVTVAGGSIYVSNPNGFSAAAVLAGELRLDTGQSLVVDGDVVIQDGFLFYGNMFVRGNVKIIGSVNMEGAVYVKGDVELKQSRTINQAFAGTDKPPLIVLADGKIVFSDSRPDGMPSSLRAFFYSTDDMQVYGVQSKLDINGGIHGRDVTLNAVREGDASTRTDTTHEGIRPPGEQTFTFSHPSTQKTLGPEHANLHLYYDQNLYLNPPAGIPTTDVVTFFIQK